MTAIERLRALVNRDEPGDIPVDLVADALLEHDDRLRKKSSVYQEGYRAGWNDALQEMATGISTIVMK